MNAAELERIAALYELRRDHFDEFDDEWQHDDGAAFWAQLPPLLDLARDGLRWRELKATIREDTDMRNRAVQHLTIDGVRLEVDWTETNDSAESGAEDGE